MSDQSPATKASAPAHDRLRGLGAQDRALMERAAQAIVRQQPAEAEPILARLSASAAPHPEVLRLRAVVLHLQKRHADALVLLRSAADRAPDDALIQNNLGTLLAETGDVEGALGAFRRSSDLVPEVAATWLNLGRMLEIAGHIDEARVALARGIAIDPDDLAARISHAQVLRAYGRADDAAAEYRHALRLKPDHLPALSALARMESTAMTAEETAGLARAYVDPAIGDGERADAGFALAMLLEKRQRYPEAYAVLAAANAVKRRLLNWNAAAFSRQVRAIGTAYATTPASTSPADLGSEMIFIVSMPRSGSTLVEQILAAHPAIDAGGELETLPHLLEREGKRRGLDFARWPGALAASEWEVLGRRYLEQTAGARRGAARLTDKGLSNWQYVGAIRAMLPGARIVDVRRDAVETCLSCWRHTFSHGQAFTYDLPELAAFARSHAHLVEAWSVQHPEHVYTLQYEALAASPQAQIASLLAFCGLEADAACLDFHQYDRVIRTASATQVRQPLRTDTARADHYGALLAPLRRAIAGG